MVKKPKGAISIRVLAGTSHFTPILTVLLHPHLLQVGRWHAALSETYKEGQQHTRDEVRDDGMRVAIFSLVVIGMIYSRCVCVFTCCGLCISVV